MAITTSKLLAHTLREFRYQLSLSQVDVAKLAAVKQTTISAFENNPDATKLETFFKILSALELELSIQPRPKIKQNSEEVINNTNNNIDEDW
ncbi:hypothetical protein QV08_06620 [Gallibacterium salpingitidis]|uniref:HTH cro/C1-type domain-containing protein n=1 Tax=Gallibacterium salpingitidis TaxID=505341 RepID=A0AB36E1S6_9PAST|nr:helix-turn-helix domain-containing protein [Gallibacterium salpingitidis]OBX07808.1 hypothetical protein QV08_06620 [Gallibacterium salpingitidis]OBX09712.1 hypothetical protein QV09_07470 [Gallibacterium salpingitidis]WKT00866.1 helix-turn-helix domain-containing protein [Gallibacterium salpingitidis]